MICPHCRIGVNINFSSQMIWAGMKDGQPVGWQTRTGPCPECQKVVIYLELGIQSRVGNSTVIGQVIESRIAYPSGKNRPCPLEVPADVARDFIQAVQVLPLSPQASAALTRRCLQHILKKYALAKKKDLADQIEEVILSN